MRADVTQVLEKIKRGDAHAAAELLPLVYEELRALARARMQHEKPGNTLQPTALVHDAYLRLVGPDDQDDHDPAHWANRAHFFAAAAEAMRRILIDRARAKRAAKRGGDHKREHGIALDALALSFEDVPEELLELDDALAALAATDARKAELVKLRFFAGLTLEQAGQVLGISAATADRDWAFAKAWLHQRIRSEAGQ